MAKKLFDSTIISQAHKVIDFMANVLEASIANSITSAMHVSFQGTEEPIHYDSLSASRNLMKQERSEQ